MTYEYRVGGEKVQLEADPSVVAIRFHDDASKSGRARATEAVGGMRPFSTRYEVPGERLTLVPVTPPTVGGVGPAEAIVGLDDQPEVAKALTETCRAYKDLLALTTILNPGALTIREK